LNPAISEGKGIGGKTKKESYISSGKKKRKKEVSTTIRPQGEEERGKKAPSARLGRGKGGKLA